jgi:hypothetical protein
LELLSVFLDKHKAFLKKKTTEKTKSPTTRLKHQTPSPASNKQKSLPKYSTPKRSVQHQKKLSNKKLKTGTEYMNQTNNESDGDTEKSDETEELLQEIKNHVKWILHLQTLLVLLQTKIF